MDGVVLGVQFALIAGLFYALVCVVRPFWLVRKRWQGGALALGAFVAFGLLNGIPVERPSSIQAGQWADRVRVCQQAHALRTCPKSDRAVAEARAKLASGRPNASEVAEQGKAEAPTKLATAAFLVGNAALKAAMRPCDEAMQKAARTHGQYNGYVVAMNGEATCRQAAIDLDNVKFAEPIPADARESLNASAHCMSMAYGARSGVMGDAAKLIDGDARPSKRAEFNAMLADAEAHVGECSQQYVVAELKHGFLDAAHMAAKPAR